MAFTLVVHHKGAFVSDPFLRYKGGDVHAFYNMEIDNWSYFEALSIVKELGYVGGVKLWWRVGKCEGKHEFKSITWDSHALEMANYAIANNCEVNMVVEHVSVAVPNLIVSLPGPEEVKETQVKKGGNCDGKEVNEGVKRKEKGKTVEVGEKKGVPNEDMDTNSGSEESLDRSLEDFFFDESEEDRMFGSDDGFDEVEKQNADTEENTIADGNTHTEEVPHTEGTPNFAAPPHNEGRTHLVAPSHNGGSSNPVVSPHNEGSSHHVETPQRSRGIRINSVPSHNPIRSPQKRAEEMKARKKGKKKKLKTLHLERFFLQKLTL
ncbi:hypothetical protein SESBI_26503 [Sesbania bispinosa]|nr:hypothetical protein SESBI_26503 [Sesbania bispinosa]